MKLYVGNLPWSVDSEGLKKLFVEAGFDVEEANLISDKYSGRSKGFGFVTIADDEAAKKAMADMHEKEIDGRKLTVNEAKPMVPRDNDRSFDKPREDRGDSGDADSSEAPMADSNAMAEDIASEGM